MLTVEEVKALRWGDWVWIVTLTNNGEYYSKFYESDDKEFVGASLYHGFTESYADYGTKWIAYKNKEQFVASINDSKLKISTAQEIFELLRNDKKLITDDYSQGYTDCIINSMKLIAEKYFRGVEGLDYEDIE